jgi:hypothetical protein
MNRVKLMTIEDRFHIRGVGVTIRSDFRVPNGHWAARTEAVIVVKPDGHNFEAIAKFNLSHFNISDPKVSIERRWRVTIMFPDMLSEDVPVGSKILVSHEIKEALFYDAPETKYAEGNS